MADGTKYAVYVVLVEDTNEAFEAIGDTYPEQYDPIDSELTREEAEQVYQAAKGIAYR